MKVQRLSPQQRRILRAGEEGTVSGSGCEITLHGPISPVALRHALEAVVAHHEELRTTFEAPLGRRTLVPKVGPDAEFDWQEIAPPDGGTSEFEREAIAPAVWTAPLSAPPLHARYLGADHGDSVLQLRLPALCADRIGLRNLVVDLARAYQARVEGSAPQLSAAAPYSRFADFQNQLLEEPDAAEGRAFWWDARVGGEPSLLPGQRAATPAVQAPPVRLERWLRSPVLADLDAALEVTEAESTEVLFGLWLTWLARIGGHADLVAVFVADGREHAILERSVGTFANALPVKAASSAEAAVITALVRVRDALREAVSWQDYLESSELPAAWTALFEPADPPLELEAGGVTFRLREVEDGGQRASLKLTASREPAGLRLVWQGFRGSFGAPELAVLADSFSAWLAAGLADLETRLGELPLLSAEMWQRDVLGFNDTSADLGAELRPLHEQFGEWARRQPAAPAVVCAGRTLSYGELEAAANRLARRLLRAGVGPEAVVGLALERSVETIVSLLAVLKAGGAYLALDPSSPAARRWSLLERSGARWLLELGGGDDEPRSSSDGFAVARLDLAGDDWRGESAEPLPPIAGPKNRAYVLFTSGSTGEPKGVEVEHRQLSSYLFAIRRVLGLPAGSRFGMVSTLAADLGNTVLFPALCGGTLRLFTYDEASDPRVMAESSKPEGVDCLKIVPSHLTALVASPEAASLLPTRVLVLGGEAPPPDLIEKVRALAPACRVINHYGPTETTVGVLTHPLSEGPVEGPVPLGRPLANSRVYVVDDRLRPVPPLVAGEIIIGGANVARGYLAAPAQTAERFVPDPFGREPGGRVYRSGDLGRFHAGGELEFLGRRDRQLKIRGFRVEPDEVAAALRRHPQVANAAVVARPDGAGHLQLVAYVEPRLPPRSASEAPLTLPNGMEVDHLNRNETLHLYRQIFEQRIYLRHGVRYFEGATIVDVGANIGLFSLFAQQQCGRARIFAFEPSPRAFEQLRRNAERYGLDARLFPLGLSDREGSARFVFYPRASIMSGFFADPAEEERLFRRALIPEAPAPGSPPGLLRSQADELAAGRFEGEELERPLTTLSAVIREHRIERIDLLKIDAEKAEHHVLRGLAEEHWDLVQQLMIEVHDVGHRVSEIVRELGERGFQVTAEEDSSLAGTGIFHLHATRLDQSPAAGPFVDRALEARGGGAVTTTELGEFLRERLPEFMVPARLVLLERLPLTRNGKLDYANLPEPEAASPAAGYHPPRNYVEQTLARIWAEVLRVERVGIHDNFFALGGDSILSIQVAAEATRAGLPLATRQLFQQQTIARLAEVVGTAATEAEQGPVVGPVPLTPIQAWFLAARFAEPQHFNQSLLLRARDRLEPGALERAVAALLAHHDALRMRFSELDGKGAQSCSPLGDAVPCERIELPDAALEEWPRSLEARAERLQQSLDLRSGPLFRAALFAGAPDGEERLLLIAHHLVIDGVSWRVILEDLQTAYEQARRGEPIHLPAKTTSFRAWSERLREYAASPPVIEQSGFWLEQLAGGPGALPADREAAGPGLIEVATRLGREATEVLVRLLPAGYRAGTQDALLLVLAEVLAAWTGRAEIAVMLEGHGREEVVEGIDLVRTVGWFTTHFPVRLRLPGAASRPTALRAVQAAREALPAHGLTFGVLRHLATATPAVERLRQAELPHLKFNYLGQLDSVLPPASRFQPASEPHGAERSPRAGQGYPLELNTAVIGGRLQAVWSARVELFARSTVEALAERYRSALERLAGELELERGTAPPSVDVALVGLGGELLEGALLEAEFEGEGEP